MSLQIEEFLDEQILSTDETYSWVLYFWKIILGGGFLILFFLCLYFAFKKEKELSPRERLLLSVEEMQKMNADLLCPEKEVYYCLVHELKVYLKHELLINIDSKNDFEIPETIEKYTFDKKLFNDLKDILDRAFKVRFAGILLERNIIGKDILWLKKLSFFQNQKKQLS